MGGRRILISPLNWGFGHAGRMIPLAAELKRRGNEVIFGVDKSLIPLVRSELPGISVTEIRGLRIRYSRHLPQYICIFLQLPRITVASVREYYDLRRLASRLQPDLIISDNRFGFRHRKIRSVYVTHQLRIAFPKRLRLMEPLGVRLHRMISSRFDHCLVPDYPGPANLSGRLSHDLPLPENVCYCGPLTRFGTATSGQKPPRQPFCCLILSGPEPQRSILLEKVIAAVTDMPLVILSTTPLHPEGTVGQEITVVTNPDTATMERYLVEAARIISRAGYTTIMELASLGRGAILIPTPGQTEQEYLGRYLNGRLGFVTVSQRDIRPTVPLRHRNTEHAGELLPDAAPLLKKALDMLLEKEEQ
jgi:uncharacterized protein (TIGR00661 family)